MAVAPAKPAADRHLLQAAPASLGPARKPTVARPDPIITSATTRPATEPAGSESGTCSAGRACSDPLAGALVLGAGASARALGATRKSTTVIEMAARPSPMAVIGACPATCGGGWPGRS